MHQAEKQTNLCDGLVSGLDMIKTVMGQQWMPPSASVLLFTDGHPTHGRAPFFFKRSMPTARAECLWPML